MSKVQRSGKGMEQLLARLDDINGKKLEAGWFESAKYDDGTPVAGIMYQNEVGNPSRSIPARPYFRPTIEDKRKEWANIAKKGFKASLNGGISPEGVLHVLGLAAVGDIKSTISSGEFAPLSQITIALRKHRNEGTKIGGAFVGSVAAAIANGETGAGQLGDQSFGNKDPLRETGFAVSTLTHEVS